MLPFPVPTDLGAPYFPDARDKESVNEVRELFRKRYGSKYDDGILDRRVVVTRVYGYNGSISHMAVVCEGSPIRGMYLVRGNEARYFGNGKTRLFTYGDRDVEILQRYLDTVLDDRDRWTDEAVQEMDRIQVEWEHIQESREVSNV